MRLTTVNALLFAFAWSSLSAEEPREVQFSRDVRPILASRCFACHGPDAQVRQAGLRLDQRQEATRELASGHRAIVPGDVAQSELLRRVTATDPDVVMPPRETKQTLTESEKRTLAAWIEQGASYELHWAFSSPRRPSLPATTDREWPRNEIDAFILARLEAEKMRPSSEAGRTTLIRRLSLDLRGLPPSVEEIDAFVNDAAPEAYEKLVDRFLASAHRGEALAQEWLDLARYGDTNGYHADSDREMWLYRNYVIESLSGDKPFDRFVTENIAGDLISDANRETQIATGFNRCNTFNEEGGADPAEFRVAYAVDRANTTGQVFLGMTFGCAQCHDHKYDPLTQREYYQFYAFFNSVDGEVGAGGPSGHHGKPLPPLLKVPTPDQQVELAQIAARTTEIETIVERELRRADDAESQPQFAADLARWAQHIRPGATDAQPFAAGLKVWLDAGDLDGDREVDDGLTSRAASSKEVATVARPAAPEAVGAEAAQSLTNAADVEGVQLAKATTTAEPLSAWRDRSGSGLEFVARGEPFLRTHSLSGRPAVRLDGDKASFRSTTGGADLQGDFTMFAVFRHHRILAHQSIVSWGGTGAGEPRAMWKFSGRHQFTFRSPGAEVKGDRELKLGEKLIGVVVYDSAAKSLRLAVNGDAAGQGSPELKPYSDYGINIGATARGSSAAGIDLAEVLIYDAALSPDDEIVVGRYLAEKYEIDAVYRGAPREIVDIAAIPEAQRSAADDRQLRDHFVRYVYQGSRATFAPLNAELQKLRREAESLRKSFLTTMVMKEKEMRNPAFVLMRGDFQNPGERVEPGVPSIFPPLPEREPRNRLGLARWLTRADHPLVARVMVNRVWKRLFGTGIVKTLGDFGTQGEFPSHPELLDWLAREFVDGGWRIKALEKRIVMSATYRQSSVDRGLYGESDPYNRLYSRAPRFRLSAEGVRDNALAISGLLTRKIGGASVKPYQPADYYADKVGRRWEQSKGEDLFRRGLYTYWRRTTLYPTFQIFDAPSREVCTVNRPRTNTPLQALVGLNDPTFVEAARAFAVRILRESGPSVVQRLRFAFRTAVARPPTAAELEVLQQIVAEQKATFDDDPEAARQLTAGGESEVPAEFDSAELAAWTAFSSVVLNLDEALTRE